MTIQSNKNLGLVGSCLLLTGAIGSIITFIQFFIGQGLFNFGVLGISGLISVLVFVGFILFLVAMHGLSKDYGEPRIFNYVIYGLVISFVLAVIVGVVWLALFFVSILSGLSTSHLTVTTTPVQMQSAIVPYYAPLLMALSAVSLVSVLYNFKAFNLLSNKSGVRQFKVAATVFVAGGIINVAIAILFGFLGFFAVIGYAIMLLASLPGGLIQYVGWAIAAKGYSKIPLAQANSSPSNYFSSASDVYCQNCSTRNQVDSLYCSRCGHRLSGR